MWFLRTIKSSVYDPVFYRSMRERKGSSAFGYFLLVVLVLALIASIAPVREIASFIFQPSTEKDMLRQQVLAVYPDELEVSVRDGKVSINAESPYFITMPEGVRDEMQSDAEKQKLPENLIVINTDTAIAADDFATYDTLVVLSADSIGILDPEQGKIQIQNLEKMFEKPYLLDKAQFTVFVGVLERVLQAAGIALLFLIPIFVFLGMALGYVIYLLFGALVIWMVAKFRRVGWSYKTSYKAGFYLMTLPLIYGEIVSSGLLPHIPIPFLFTGILFVMALINIGTDKEVGEPDAPAETPTEMKTETPAETMPETR